MFELIPSLGRNRKMAGEITILDEERNLIEMAKFKLPGVFHEGLCPIELLALLQHHGVPTRLLDVTENALVALYFACSDTDKDGEVFAFKENELDITNYPVVNAIADSYRFIKASNCPLDIFYKAVVLQPYFLEQKCFGEKTDEEQEQWIYDCCKTPFFIYASVQSPRQKLQQGRYLLFNNEIVRDKIQNKLCFRQIIKPMKKDHSCICGRIIIPKSVKEQIIKDLRLFGISRETLFGDSIDIVCEEIVNKFNNKIKGKRY